MLDFSPIWQAPAIRRALSEFELFEIARVMARFNRVAGFIENANHRMM
jgi:hypothetical protein